MDVAVADHKAEAVRMRQDGASQEDIRKALGYKSTRSVRRLLAEVPKPPRPERALCVVKVRDPLEAGLPADILTSRDRRVHRFIAQRAKERERRLEGLLRASGMTVAQMTTERLCGGATWLLRQWDA